MDGEPEHNPVRCAQWAMSGVCEGPHAEYMRQFCAEECRLAKERDPNAGKPPPADIWLWIIVAGFAYLAIHVVKRTIQADGEVSHQVAKKTLGIDRGVGPGKPNRSALQLQKRSAKKS